MSSSGDLRFLGVTEGWETARGGGFEGSESTFEGECWGVVLAGWTGFGVLAG